MSDTTSPWVRTIATTAGGLEREAKSRRFNALEAFGLITFILIILWPFCYLCGVLGGSETVQNLAMYPLILGALYILFVSPFLHKDTLDAWGLGNPLTLWRMMTQGPPAKRAAIIAIVTALFLVLNYVNYWRWPDVVRFFQAHETPLRDCNQGFPGLLVVFGAGTCLSALIITFGIRYDNFLPAFKTAMTIALPMFGTICLGAYVQRGAQAFSGFEPSKFLLDVLGYLFWGFTQQLLFSSYFGTRVRKAFGPSANPNNAVPKNKRPQTALLFGAVLALIASPTAFIALRCSNPPGQLPWSAMLWFAAFAFPVGAVYGYVYSLDKKRLLTATLAASIFGVIHVDSYGLVFGTWLLGTALIYVFMEAKNRNLVALGFIHGLNGSTLGWLFSHNESGALEIDYSVGPWNVDTPTLGVLLFPMLCIAAYIGVTVWCAKNIREDGL